MHRLFYVLLIPFLLSVALVGYPKEPEVIGDYANLLSKSAENKIESIITEYEGESDIEIKVVTINAISDYSGTSRNFETFATQLFNHWQIGDRFRNDGVLFLISKSDRKMRIEVGSGYGLKLNTQMKSIILETVVPEFKQGDFTTGITDGTSDIIRALKIYDSNLSQNPDLGLSSENSHSRPGSLLQDPYPNDYTSDESVRPKGFIGWILGVLGTLAAGGVALIRFLPKKCRKCKITMLKLSEATEDDYLDEKQQFEEQIGSVNYDVWECPTCNDLRVCRYSKLFSRYKKCPACNTKSLMSESETIRYATTRRSGLKRIHNTCKYCGHEFSFDRIIPQKTESSSSSSSSSGFSSGGGNV